MGRPPKSHTPIPLIAQHLAENVKLLRDRVYAIEPSETARNKRLAAEAGTSLSQVQRILKGATEKHSVGIDVLERLARALKCRPQDLVTPYFANTGLTNGDNGEFSHRRAS